jgi:hypothetical protein
VDIQSRYLCIINTEYPGNQGSIPCKEWDIFLYSIVSGPILQTTQLPIEWLSGVSRQQEPEADHSTPYTGDLKNAWTYNSTYSQVIMTSHSRGRETEFSFSRNALRSLNHFQCVSWLLGDNLLSGTHSVYQRAATSVWRGEHTRPYCLYDGDVRLM